MECEAEHPKQQCIDKIIGICDQRIKEAKDSMELKTENFMLKMKSELTEVIQKAIKEAIGNNNKFVTFGLEILKTLSIIIGLSWTLKLLLK